MPLASYAKFSGIEGSCNKEDERKGTVVVLEMDHTVEIPVDVKDATSTGTRVHRPIKLVCNIDKATPRLMQHVTTSEIIPEATIQFWQINEGGEEVNYFNINLTKVRIVKAQTWFPNVDDEATGNYKDMITYSLRYDSIQWDYKEGNLSHTDQWSKS